MTTSQHREVQRELKRTREALTECAVRYEWDRSDEHERALRAAAADMSLAILRGAASNHGSAESILKAYIAGCRAAVVAP